MEEEKITPMKITLSYDDGSTEEKEIGGIFDADNGKTYAVLYDNRTITEGAIEFIRLIPFTNDDGIEDFHIESLESEEEYEVVTRAFNEIISDSNESVDATVDDSETAPIKTLDGEEILLSDESGERVKWILVKMFDFQTHTYAVMRKKSEDELHILRAVISDSQNSNFSNCRFDGIDDDDEFVRVQEYFIKTYSNEF